MPDIAAARPVSGAPIETSWGDQVHDLLEGVQSGTFQNGPLSATVAVLSTITFPRPYAVAPIVVASIASVVCQGRILNITTTTFQYDAKRNDGNASMTTQPVNWLAVGTLA